MSTDFPLSDWYLSMALEAVEVEDDVGPRGVVDLTTEEWAGDAVDLAKAANFAVVTHDFDDFRRRAR